MHWKYIIVDLNQFTMSKLHHTLFKSHCNSWTDIVYLFEGAGEEVDERQSEDDPQHPALPQ